EIVVFVYGWGIEPRWIRVRSIDLPTDKLSHTSLRIVQITDLHCERKIRNAPGLPLIINQLSPDLIVFTGDALNSYEGLPMFKKTLASLEARIGKYASLGNMDVRNWKEHDFFGETLFEVLDGRSISLEKETEAFYVSGLSYGEEERYEQVLSSVPESVYSILLCHTPDLAEKLQDFNIDLYLAGHTHGGQVNLPLLGTPVLPPGLSRKYSRGRYRIGDLTLYVNPGIGMEQAAPRVRFGVRPEITVFDIHPESP
ncbi:MAG: metallophosphoesterase, partial [Planctomycetes bacterium]|nr:metallophosphoesterase [Planctomycetota bacterium]